MQGPDTFSLPVGVLSKLGMPIERLCAHAGVAPSNAWVTSEFFRIWEAAEEQFNDPSAGIRFGDEGIARGYGVAALVALHAPDFRSALAALSRYKSLTCPELVEVEAKGGEAVVRYRWLQASGPVPRLLVDMTMASLRRHARKHRRESCTDPAQADAAPERRAASSKFRPPLFTPSCITPAPQPQGRHYCCRTVAKSSRRDGGCLHRQSRRRP